MCSIQSVGTLMVMCSVPLYTLHVLAVILVVAILSLLHEARAYNAGLSQSLSGVAFDKESN